MNQSTRIPTAFERQVYGALGEIPRGRVATYAALAARLDCGSAQAVGQALKRNPFAPEVPCHRVIKTDLTLGGYSGKVKGVRVERKRHLLEEEGVEFDEEGRLLDEALVWDWK
ncbi:MAG: MGMT family protein [Verrucomicrobia bacterium]|nr:MGMT family protein [Verrucomicrobiota bacterium]MDA1006771.1 MGMT family protein [Verrucomicrobiota bacterium]